MKEKDKISLIKDIKKGLKVDKETMKIQQDERVITETNKVMSGAYNILVAFLVIFTIVGETFNWEVSTRYIFAIIGIISYTMLLIFCKKMVVDGNEHMMALLIWSFLTLPLSVFNMVSDFIYNNIPYKLGGFIIFIPICVVIVWATIMYQIANYIYKKSNQQEIE